MTRTNAPVCASSRAPSGAGISLLAILFGAAVGSTGLSAAPLADPSQVSGATSPASDPSTLRICGAANQLPYSSVNGSGFENKIGKVVAETMGRKPIFVYADKPAIYIVRDWLDKNKCDVVVGLDAGDQRVLATNPYYRAGYAFVTKKDRGINVDSWNDPKVKQLNHIVVDFGSPSEAMLKEIGVYNDDMAYLYSLVGFRAPRNEYVQIPPERMIAEVKEGGSDMAAAFAPDVARFVKEDPSLQMIPIKDDATHNGGEKLAQQYEQSMGVRLADAQLQSALNDALVKAKPQIDAILRDEGIPVLPATN